VSASSSRTEAKRSPRQGSRRSSRMVERAAANVLPLSADERQEAVDTFAEVVSILREWDEAERKEPGNAATNDAAGACSV